MRSGIKPRVNEAREFLEIAKDFKDPREIIREALSNSWDAGASKTSIRFDLAPIPGTQRKKIMVEIIDDGLGMNDEQRAAIGSSEIEGFFNLGDSAKPHGSIGSKGHGTKIFYKSLGINLETWKNGAKFTAVSDQPPWETLQKGVVPTYSLDDTKDNSGKGTRIRVDGFQAKQKDFSSLSELVDYIRWYTVAGSFGNYFNSPRRMDVVDKKDEFRSILTEAPLPAAVKCQTTCAAVKEDPIRIVGVELSGRLDHAEPKHAAIEGNLLLHVFHVEDDFAESSNHVCVPCGVFGVASSC